MREPPFACDMTYTLLQARLRDLYHQQDANICASRFACAPNTCDSDCLHVPVQAAGSVQVWRGAGWETCRQKILEMMLTMLHSITDNKEQLLCSCIGLYHTMLFGRPDPEPQVGCSLWHTSTTSDMAYLS